MKKNKKRELEDKYYLLTIILTEISCLCFIITYFSFPLVLNIILFSIMIILELLLSAKISIENKLKKSILSLSISSLSIILLYMIISTFSNHILKYLIIGKYFILYVIFLLLNMINYNYLYKNKKILANIILTSIYILYLILIIILI